MRQDNKIICNKCGKEILVEKNIYHKDVLTVEKRWAYTLTVPMPERKIAVRKAIGEILESFLQR